MRSSRSWGHSRSETRPERVLKSMQGNFSDVGMRKKATGLGGAGAGAVDLTLVTS